MTKAKTALGAGGLVPYEDFAHRLHGVRRRTLERLSDAGGFPPYVRWTKKAPPLWSAREVEAWIEARLVQAWPHEETFDGEFPDATRSPDLHRD